MLSYALIRILPAAMVLMAAGCVTKKDREAKNPPPHLDRAVPEKIMAGEPFQVQPNGKSALSVVGTQLRRGSRVRLNGQPLDTSSGDGTTLSALVPSEMFAEPGLYPVTVETAEGQLSNAIPFVVLPKTGPAPVIKQLYPSQAEVGKPFNEQPGGVSAIGITGQNFLPGAVVEINGEAQTTAFGNVDQVSSLVPKKFIDKPGSVRITVRNKDGKVSVPAILTITAAK